MKNSIVYNSGVAIWDGDFLSTLCVFYDEVFLPAFSYTNEMIAFETPLNSDDPIKLRNVTLDLEYKHEGEMYTARELVEKWEKYTEILFKESVMKRLPPTKNIINVEKHFDISLYNNFRSILLDIHENIYLREKNKRGGRNDIGAWWKDHLLHLLRNDIDLPSFFITPKKDVNREEMKTLIANCAFKYFLPSLTTLHPEQIMEIRREVKSNREGFSMHLQSLTHDIETRILEGDTFEDIKQYAESVTETKLIPDYFEFKRQLAAKRTGFWGNVLDKASKIAEIDSGPLTPKFYADILKILGFTMLAGISEQEDQLTNKSQSFLFIKKAEDLLIT